MPVASTPSSSQSVLASSSKSMSSSYNRNPRQFKRARAWAWARWSGRYSTLGQVPIITLHYIEITGAEG